ncbi:DUF2971 domain-containing protein [Sporolactobacillus sp. THM19-2]|nr:DUF2971 domain-containing protein [Sporolactobacillus sp. THM19-2]
MTNLLYHYCSVETFGLIMKNKTFRFSSLGVVDDMEESMTSDYKNIGKICFVSCWTDLVQESVEMWRTYTGGVNGVRIGLPRNLFSTGLNEKEIFKLSRQIGDKCDVSISPPYQPDLIPITYTKDDYLINLSVVKKDNEVCKKCGKVTANFNLDTRYLGRFKRNYWSGQSEWRYRLIAIPLEYYRNNQSGKYLKGKPEEMVELMQSDLIKMTFNNDYIDFPFNENVFEEMEILLSPLNAEEDNDVVKSIVKKYTNLTDFEFKSSELKIRK